MRHASVNLGDMRYINNADISFINPGDLIELRSTHNQLFITGIYLGIDDKAETIRVYAVSTNRPYIPTNRMCHIHKGLFNEAVIRILSSIHGAYERDGHR